MKKVIPVIYLLLLRPAVPAQEETPLIRQFLLNRDIVALAQAGYGEQTIIETLLAKRNRFDTNADALVELAGNGISERVIEAMLLAKTCGPIADRANGPAGCAEEMEKLRRAAGRGASNQLPVAAKGVAYRASFDMPADARCPMADTVLSLASGTLPPGLKLSLYGLDGVPMETGRFRFTVRVGNGCSSRTRTLELEVTGKPILQASPDEITFNSRSPGQKPGARAMLVSSTWPDLPYRVEKQDADWLEVRLTNGRTPANSALTGDTVTLTADPAKLKPGTYRGALLFSTPGGANAQSVPVVFVVGGGE